MQAIGLKLNEYINEYLKLWDFYGVIQVTKKGEVIYEGAYGHASIEFDIKNDMNSRFSIASMSKQFTAFAIMILYDKKMLDIDKPAQLYLPAEMQIEESITIHHLLSHTSGLYNFTNFEDDFFAGYNRMNFSQDDFFQKYINKEPKKPAGTVYDYNNSNYNLLAWIIENVSGETYDEFLQKHIFLPLHMISSEVDDGCKTIKYRSCNYVYDFDTPIKSPYFNEKFSIGAGAIVSNCDDLYKWFTCLRDQKILSKEAYSRFFSVNQNNYCYGLEHHHVYGTDRFSHGGDHLGISTYMQNFFEEDICIIILSNNETINQYRLGNAISNILYHVDAALPTKHQEIPLNERQFKKYCGTYLKHKIKIEFINSKLYFTRFSNSLHIEIYPVGEGQFVRRHYDQIEPYRIVENEDGEMMFFGFIKKSL